MKFTIELVIGLSFVLQAALPQLVTDRETKLIVVGGPSDRRAIAGAAPGSGNPLRVLRLHADAFAAAPAPGGP